MSMSTEPWPLTDEQRAIVALCREFATNEIRPRGREVDERDVESPLDIFRAAAKVGITDFMLPEEYGGGGFTDVVTQCLVQEQMCWGDPGIGNFVCSNGFFADPLLELGTDRQKAEWLRPLAGPNPLCTALATTEPESGSDAASIVTTAVRVDGGYSISGQKAWISNAGLADQYVVFAKTDPARGSSGVTAFLLRKGAAGMTFGEPMRKMGQRAIVCREVFFDEVFVPESDRLGDEGHGFRGLMRTFDISRIVLHHPRPPSAAARTVGRHDPGHGRLTGSHRASGQHSTSVMIDHFCDFMHDGDGLRCQRSAWRKRIGDIPAERLRAWAVAAWILLMGCQIRSGIPRSLPYGCMPDDPSPSPDRRLAAELVL